MAEAAQGPGGRAPPTRGPSLGALAVAYATSTHPRPGWCTAHLHFQYRIPLGPFGLGSDARLPWCVDIASNHPIYHDRQGLYDIATTDLVPFFQARSQYFLPACTLDCTRIEERYNLRIRSPSCAIRR